MGPPRDTEESDTEKDFLNENVIPGTPTAKTSGIVSTIIKKCEGLTGKLKKKKVETQSAPAPAATVRSSRRLSEVFNKGDHVEALWQDRNPELRKFYKASIVAVVSSGLYKVRFLDDGQYRFVSKKDLRRA
ncbi:uncharacterized protein LOC123558043 [Mercenaria mercenaria]|uniref:uncharacterized protein LOC123558043 n=1 Tax=Mercenaria mercenaria TaxID=6596 RepID=UPI00234F8EF5|nr:uncharacterized protein LOC123558043 [Mercenaria mercenaria]